MVLTKEIFTRETNISAKVIADSISPSGVRITTFELEAPRIILAEINTHRALGKNCSSSRAIPIKKMVQQILDNGFTPIYWGKKQSGMQAGEEITGDELSNVKEEWEYSRAKACDIALSLEDNGLHKQIANRITEPFQMIKQVVTGTDFDNFFNLRLHKDSQPEFCVLAYKMYVALQESKPTPLQRGEWHLPYVESCYSTDKDTGNTEIQYYVETDGKTPYDFLTLEQAIRYSSAQCAAVSYRTEAMTLEKADKIFDMLVKAEVIHSSPFEHLATPVVFDGSVNESNLFEYMKKTEGITHINRNGEFCSGNLRGYVQYRQLLKSNTCYRFNFEERLKLFGE